MCVWPCNWVDKDVGECSEVVKYGGVGYVLASIVNREHDLHIREGGGDSDKKVMKRCIVKGEGNV